MEQEQKYETTAEHFEAFKAEARRFIDMFGLWDWRVDFEHSYQEDSFAVCEHNTTSGKIATLILSTDWSGTEPTLESLRQSAFHEVCHILLADTYDAACCLDLSPMQRHLHIDRAHHAIIRRLENVVLPRL